MKKTIKIVTTCFFLSFLLTSCFNEWLNIYPEDDIVEDKFWNSKYDVESVMLSCYRFMVAPAFMDKVIQWGEIRSDNVVITTAAGVDESRLCDFNTLTTNSICSWTDFYKVINICNLVLEKAPKVFEIDINFREDELKSYQAEALTIRAICYFYLIRTFGDVPWVENASKTDGQNFYLPQSSDKEIIARLISDLIQAEEYAKSLWSTANQSKGRITKNAVRALMADIYLWNAQYNECKQTCDRLLNDPLNVERLVLESSENYQWFRNLFYVGNSTESIFELNFSIPGQGQSNTSTRNLYGNGNQNVRAHFNVSSSLAGSYANNIDFRGLYFMERAEGGAPIFKYEGMTPAYDFTFRENYSYRGSNTSANWIVYRLPDIFLMKAEAELEQNPTSDQLHSILSLINRTYTRATVNKDSLLFERYSTAEQIKIALLEERRREFAFEGKRWFDLMRKVKKDGNSESVWMILEPNFSENVSLIKNKLSMYPAWYLPIHQDEMNINPNLHQNDFYKTQER